MFWSRTEKKTIRDTPVKEIDLSAFFSVEICAQWLLIKKLKYFLLLSMGSNLVINFFNWWLFVLYIFTYFIYYSIDFKKLGNAV